VKKAYPIAILCEVMLVSRSGYYAWRGRGESVRHAENLRLIPLVCELHRASDRTYGTRRISEDLQAAGIVCGRSRARNLMSLAGVTAKQTRKFKATTNSKHDLPVAPNLLERQFNVAEPNRVWTSDITYIWTAEGWLYLAVVMDLFNRRIVGWSMNNRITKQIVMDAFRMAFLLRHPASGLICHSDRGSQYCSYVVQKLLKAYGALSSMSKKGDCWDNAVTESFFGTLKTERVFFSNYKTRDEARKDIFDYIEMFYNSRRRHSHLGYVSPRDFEESWLMKKAA